MKNKLTILFKQVFIGFFLLLIVSIQSKAQEKVLLLKDGSRLYGQVVDQDSVIVKFKIRGTKETYSIRQESIQSFTESTETKNFFQKPQGAFVFHLQAGSGFYETQYETIGWLFQAKAAFGKKINEKSFIGMGIGIENQVTLVMIPITAEYVRIFNGGRYAPIAQLSVGGNYLANRGGQNLQFDKRISLCLKPQIGFRVNRKKTPITFMMGYNQSKASYTYGWIENRYNEDRVFKRLSFNIGLLF